MLDDGGASYKNYSGCGNTINGNHPIVRELIFLCLRHWVHNYHVDGFRFDLATHPLAATATATSLPNPPIVEVITEDPMLADTKIIAEAWDAAGAYQVGSFASLRWAEWNGRYRDDVRRFWRGDFAQTGHLATRLAGSSDLYGDDGRQPYHSINFVTSHDGFTLNDLVTYREKHNEANGEGNRDGDNNNYTDNYGVEGPTKRAGDRGLRGRGRSRTCWPRCCSARACRCWCRATSAAGRSRATTTPTARTTPSPGSTGGWWSGMPIWCGSCGP